MCTQNQAIHSPVYVTNESYMHILHNDDNRVLYLFINVGSFFLVYVCVGKRNDSSLLC